MLKELLTHSESETEKFATEVASLLRGGEIFLLESDLGGGKTAFTRGLARGLGSSDDVSSPTFVLSHIYKGKHELHHYDFYRLGEMGLMSEELQEVLADGDAVVAIEWPHVVKASLPEERLLLIVLKRQNTAENDRLLQIYYPTTLSYLFSDSGERAS